MLSEADDAPLPAATSETLVIDFPTEDEKLETRLQHQAQWGGGLGAKDYLTREQYLETIPLAANGGIRVWILTERVDDSRRRRILASCETWRKRALASETAAEDGTPQLRSGIAYGIGTVFTNPQYRGRGYCHRMLHELRNKLIQGFETADDGQPIRPLASALWSDIGRAFYAKRGWLPHESFHVVLSLLPDDDSVVLTNSRRDTTTSDHSAAVSAYDVTLNCSSHNSSLKDLAEQDESLLRTSMAAEATRMRSLEGAHKTTLFALVPDFDTLRWHLYRDAWIAQKLFPSQVAEERDDRGDDALVVGAVAGQPGARIWAVWTRSYHHAPVGRDEAAATNADGENNSSDSSKNTLTILRLVIENDAMRLEQLAAAFAAVIARARRVANSWHLGQILLWNPSPAAKAIIQASGIAHQLVERQHESIPSLLWYGDEADKVRWVANEKFGWC